MLLKALGASVGVFLVIVVYMAFAPAAQGVGLAMLNFTNVCINGTCVSQVASNAYFLFGVGVVRNDGVGKTVTLRPCVVMPWEWPGVVPGDVWVEGT